MIESRAKAEVETRGGGREERCHHPTIVQVANILQSLKGRCVPRGLVSCMHKANNRPLPDLETRGVEPRESEEESEEGPLPESRGEGSGAAT